MQTIDHTLLPSVLPAAPVTPPDARPAQRATQRIAVKPIVPRQKTVLSARDIQNAEDGGEQEGEAHPS